MKPGTITVTKMEPAHLEQVHQIEQLVFSQPWSYESLLSQISNPAAVFFTAHSGSACMGYIGMHHVLDECYIANIAVHPDFQRCGIGTVLLQGAVDYANENQVARIALEVRQSNSRAIALYEKFGFRQDGLRPGYYDKPKEDALLYSLYFLGVI